MVIFQLAFDVTVFFYAENKLRSLYLLAVAVLISRSYARQIRATMIISEVTVYSKEDNVIEGRITMLIRGSLSNGGLTRLLRDLAVSVILNIVTTITIEGK